MRHFVFHGKLVQREKRKVTNTRYTYYKERWGGNRTNIKANDHAVGLKSAGMPRICVTNSQLLNYVLIYNSINLKKFNKKHLY